MIVYYNKDQVDSCMDCKNLIIDGPLNRAFFVCSAMKKAIGPTSRANIGYLENYVHEKCPFRNLKENQKTER
jgi:hypothetical protein